MKTKILSFTIAILQIILSVIIIYGLYLSLSFFFNVLKNNSPNFKYSDLSIFKLFKNYIIEFVICLFGLFGGFLILFKIKIGEVLSLTFWLSLLALFIFSKFELFSKSVEKPTETKEIIYLLIYLILNLLFISFYIFKNKFSKKDYIFPIAFLLFYTIIKLI